jgi:hypothetical protein
VIIELHPVANNTGNGGTDPSTHTHGQKLDQSDQRPILNFAPRGKLWPRGLIGPQGWILFPGGGILYPRGEFCSLGVKFSVRPFILLNSRKCSPRGAKGWTFPLGNKLPLGGQGWSLDWPSEPGWLLEGRRLLVGVPARKEVVAGRFHGGVSRNTISTCINCSPFEQWILENRCFHYPFYWARTPLKTSGADSIKHATRNHHEERLVYVKWPTCIAMF